MIGVSIALFLTLYGFRPIIVESNAIGGAASGKAGGFLAKEFMDGSVREPLAHLSYALHKLLASSEVLDGTRQYQFRYMVSQGFRVIGFNNPLHPEI